MTQAEILKEIEDFNILLDKISAKLRLKLPESFNANYVATDEEKEHERLVSFQTKVDCLVDFWDA